MKKYTLYAAGEILLVVVGILIALWINNLNQQRIEAQKGIVYLERIQEDLAKDTVNILNHIGIIERKVDVLVEILNLNLDSINYFGKQSGIFITRFRDPLFLNKIALDELVNSGNVNLIKNVELREKILNHYTIWEGVAKAIQENTLGDYPSLISQIIPGEEQFRARVEGFKYENKETFEEMLKLEIRNNFASLRPAINAELGYAATRVSFYQVIHKKTLHLIGLVEKELRLQR